jgi:flagellar biosynthesis/type III secretory pathway chaperone
MQITSEQRAALSALITAELNMAKGMLELLTNEHALLTKGDPDAIKSISNQKLEHMQLMEQNISGRNQFLRSLGLTSDEQGLEKAVATMEDLTLSATWDELKSTAKQLKKQNEINGGIITLGQRRVKQALDILSGKENLTGTYSQQGETQFSKSNNLHTKA